MLATVAAADSASPVRKKFSVFIYSEAEPHAKYAIYKQTLTLCVLQYFNHKHVKFFIKIRHDIIKQFRGKKFNYKLEIEIFRNSTHKKWVS